MRLLPFEVGYLSTMSDGELYDLVDELERDGYWDDEDHMRRTIDRALQQWAHAPAFGVLPFPMLTRSAYKEPSLGASVRPTTHHILKTINLRAPQGIPPRAARLIFELQYREQTDPSYDPTDEEE